MKLPDAKILGQADLAHQRVHILARNHARNGCIIHMGYCGVEFVEVGTNLVSAADGISMARDQQVRTEFADRIERSR